MFKTQLFHFLAGASKLVRVGSLYFCKAPKVGKRKYSEKAIEGKRKAFDEMLDRRIKAQEKRKTKKEKVSTVAENKEKDREELNHEVTKNNYMPKEDMERKTEETKRPYTISPEVFGEGAQEITNWVFWSDGIISDEMSDEILSDEDVEKYIGKRSLGRFGEYEDDAVYVRNEYLGFDVY